MNLISVQQSSYILLSLLFFLDVHDEWWTERLKQGSNEVLLQSEEVHHQISFLLKMGQHRRLIIL